MSLEVHQWKVCLHKISLHPPHSTDVCAFLGRSGEDRPDNTVSNPTGRSRKIMTDDNLLDTLIYLNKL